MDNLKEILFEPSKVEWFQIRIADWAVAHLRDFPWRHTDNEYEIFVAEFLLQQTDAPRVVPVYKHFLFKYPDLQSLAQAEEADLHEILKPLGFHFRALRLRQAALLLINDAKYQGKVPSDIYLLQELPGVGKYVAQAICATAFHQSVAVLDTNVVRILQRFFGLMSNRARPRNDPKFWKAAQEIAVKNDVRLWNLSIIDFGALICTSRKPRCEICPLREKCDFYLTLISAMQTY